MFGKDKSMSLAKYDQDRYRRFSSSSAAAACSTSHTTMIRYGKYEKYENKTTSCDANKKDHENKAVDKTKAAAYSLLVLGGVALGAAGTKKAYDYCSETHREREAVERASFRKYVIKELEQEKNKTFTQLEIEIGKPEAAQLLEERITALIDKLHKLRAEDERQRAEQSSCSIM